MSATARVLVVDDEDSNIQLLSRPLLREGYAVEACGDGTEALARVLANPPDVLLLDVRMPEPDGFEVCRRIRAEARTAHLPVLLVTGLDSRADRLRGIAAGASDFLPKPVDVQDLLLRVRNAVRTQQLYRALQESYERLRHMEERRDQLVHMLVHDMRTPLSIIHMALSMVEEDVPGLPGEDVARIRIARAQALRLIDMCSAILDVRRMQETELPLRRSACDLAQLAQEAAEGLAPATSDRTLHIEPSPVPLAAFGDAGLLLRVFTNLLANAVRFSPPRASVHVTFARMDTHVEARIRDEGKGIPPEHHASIFEPYSRLAGEPEKGKYSTGLGLTFCRMVVERHGGTIGVESAPGQGSTFWFRIPAMPAPAHESPLSLQPPGSTLDADSTGDEP